MRIGRLLDEVRMKDRCSRDSGVSISTSVQEGLCSQTAPTGPSMSPSDSLTAPLSPRLWNWLGFQPSQDIAPDKHPRLPEQKQHAENPGPSFRPSESEKWGPTKLSYEVSRCLKQLLLYCVSTHQKSVRSWAGLMEKEKDFPCIYYVKHNTRGYVRRYVIRHKTSQT